MCSLVAAVHVVLSVLAMHAMGAGVHLSELMAKRLCLVAGVAMWKAHVSHAEQETLSSASLPPPANSPRRSNPPSGASILKLSSSAAVGPDHIRGSDRRTSLLLLGGRLVIAALIGSICGLELRRLLFTEMSHFGTVSEWGAPTNADLRFDPARCPP